MDSLVTYQARETIAEVLLAEPEVSLCAQGGFASKELFGMSLVVYYLKLESFINQWLLKVRVIEGISNYN